jgi:hypothetical protein
MPVTIDDERAQVLEGANRLMDQLLTNPKTKHVVERAIKEIHPAVVTDADRAQPLIAAITNVNKKVDQTINYLRSKELDGALGAQFDKVKTDYGFTDEGIDELKKFMIAEKIPQAEAAAALWQRRHPPAPPQAPSLFAPQEWGFGRVGTDEDRKLLWTNEDAWAEKQARKVLEEIAKGQLTE